MAMFSSSVALLASELYSTHGGVQAYGRCLAEILSAYNDSHRGALDCVSLLDERPVESRHRQPLAYRTFYASRGIKLRFARQALMLGYRSKPGRLVIGHLGLAPVGWVLKRAGFTRSYVVVLHGIEAWQRVDWSDRVAIRDASAVVTTTQFTALEFCRHNEVPFRRMRIIPLAVSESAIEESGPVQASHGDPLRVLTVTRMTLADGYKGVDTLIDAVGRVKARNIGITLEIVGTGDEVPRLKRRAEGLNLNGAVTFAGAVPDEELGRSYRACDVFALPSAGEGFGIVFLEAMRYGKPCIGGNHGGTPEVISHGNTGYLVRHGDVESLSRCLTTLAASPELRLAMGQKAAHAVRTRYLFTHMQSAWFSLLDELAQADGP